MAGISGLRRMHRITAMGSLLLLLLVLGWGVGANLVYGETASDVKVLAFAEIAAPIYLAVDRGTSMDDMKASLKREAGERTYDAWYCPGNDAEEIKVPCGIIWDLSPVNPSKSGIYLIRGALDIPAGYALPEDTSNFYYDDVPTAYIIVSEPGRIDLSNPIVNDSGNIICRWSWSIPDISAASVEHAVGEGQWQALEQGDTESGIISYHAQAEGCSARLCMLQANEMQVEPEALARMAMGAFHYFRIGYDGAYSDVLRVTIPADWQGDPDTLEIEWDGDRDMIDRAGDELDSMEQPAVDMPDSDRSKSASRQQNLQSGYPSRNIVSIPVTERVTDTQTVISRTRLRDLAERDPQSVLFEKQGIALYLPADFLLGLDLKADDTFKVTIRREANGFFISVFVNGEPLSEIPRALIRIPLDGLEKGGNYSLLWLEGDVLLAAEADADAGMISTYITGMGHYEIKSDDVTAAGISLNDDADRSDPGFSGGRSLPAVAFILTAILCIGGYMIFLARKKAGKNRRADDE